MYKCHLHLLLTYALMAENKFKAQLSTNYKENNEKFLNFAPQTDVDVNATYNHPLNMTGVLESPNEGINVRN